MPAYTFNLYSSGTAPEWNQTGAAIVAGFFFNDTATTEIYTLSLHDALPILSGADQYTVWSTDSNGNYITNTSLVSGNSTTLESFETTFHQDLNGDGIIGIPPSHTSPALELAGTSSDPVTFTGSPSTLILETPTTL